jgi:fatty acid desaturase
LDSETVQRHKILTEDFARLQEEIQAEGLLDPDPVRYAMRLVQAFVIFLIGLAMSYTLGTTSIFLRVLSVVVMTLGGGQALWLGHEGGHNGFTGQRQYDRVIQTILYGTAIQISNCPEISLPTFSIL